MAAHLRVYPRSHDSAVADAPEPTVRISLGDLLPLIALAHRNNYLWLQDFLDDEVCVTADHHSVNINFNDNTAIVLSMEPSFTLFPYLGDWKTEECEVLKEWPEIKSISLRA